MRSFFYKFKITEPKNSEGVGPTDVVLSNRRN